MVVEEREKQAWDWSEPRSLFLKEGMTCVCVVVVVAVT